MYHPSRFAPALMALAPFLLAACDTPSADARAAYVERNGTLVEVPYDYADLAANAPELLDAIDRNPRGVNIDRQFNGRDLTNLSQAEIADLSLAAAREICNIPEGQVITASTPCNF